MSRSLRRLLAAAVLFAGLTVASTPVGAILTCAAAQSECEHDLWGDYVEISCGTLRCTYACMDGPAVLFTGSCLI